MQRHTSQSPSNDPLTTGRSNSHDLLSSHSAPQGATQQPLPLNREQRSQSTVTLRDQLLSTLSTLNRQTWTVIRPDEGLIQRQSKRSDADTDTAIHSHHTTEEDDNTTTRRRGHGVNEPQPRFAVPSSPHQHCTQRVSQHTHTSG
jgi:hypothetical protein